MAGLSEAPSGERIHIGFFGLRNAGKSSLVNAVCNQGVSVVSNVAGTTTDAVRKSMELLPLGPVVIIDTPGIDDEGGLGELRVKAAKRVLASVDIAVLVSSAKSGLSPVELELVGIFKDKKIPYIIAYNKSDIAKNENVCNYDGIFVSAVTGEGIEELKKQLGNLCPQNKQQIIVSDLISPNDFVVLVTPIDSAAPKGRLILPQQQVLRDVIDSGATAVVTREHEYAQTLKMLVKKPSLVVTDSQVFKKIACETSDDIPLTSFSILMARLKGFLEIAVHGAREIDNLQNGDTVLISEGCTHHRQCGDIGTVKLPAMLKDFTDKEIQIKTSSGKDFPEDLSGVSLVIHCGGCMLTSREVLTRMKIAENEGIPVTNFGTAIAYMNGILDRTISMLPEFEN